MATQRILSVRSSAFTRSSAAKRRKTIAHVARRGNAAPAPLFAAPLRVNSRVYRAPAASCRPFRRTSFPSLGATTVAPVLRSLAPADAPPQGLGCLFGRPPAAPLFYARGDGRISQVPAQTLLPPCSCSFEDRTNRPELALTLRPTRPREREQPWLSRCTFEPQSHGLTTRCQRFKAPHMPRHDARFASHLRGYALLGELQGN